MSTTVLSQVQVRYFAGAKAALGRGEETRDIVAGDTIESLLAQLGTALDPAAITVLGRCSFILNGVATTERRVPLQNGDRLDVLPPFAGG
jgi:molybdopterin synthase sulfur carrier subunit